MIDFISELVNFKMKAIRKKKTWLKKLVVAEGYRLVGITYVFMNDEQLIKINQEFLKHDTYTDIITFDTSDTENDIESDIYISIERVKENASTYGVDFEQELIRVMAHGVLHLCGYKDKSKADIAIMRAKEAFYIQQYQNEL
jgi:probable rRNA maturation factor